MKLFPRLPNRYALEVYAEQAVLTPDQIEGAAAHRLMIWPATGADRIGEADLLAIRDRLLEVVQSHGYPAPLSRSAQNGVDIDLAQALWGTTDLAPAEAGFPDVWSFLALVLVPEIVWWRASGSTNVERFVASDLTRHTLARLWWRAQLFTWGLDDPNDGWELWRTSPIGEAELDQIQTRRGGYGRSPRAFRALVETYPTVVALADEQGVDRRRFWRQAFLPWILRLGAFLNLAGMPETQLREDMFALARELAAPSPDLQPEDEAGERAPALPAEEPSSFDEIPLSTLVVRLTEAVRATGEVAREDMASAFERVCGIPVPLNRADILPGIAWQAKALKYLDNGDGETNSVWRAGRVLPAPDRRWGEWTIASFKAYVKSNGRRDPKDLQAALFKGRPGQTVRRIVRAVVNEDAA
jgi:hypothetical protein